MFSKPLVTVIVPSYNHSRYIGYTIESILNQTLKNFELLIFDDSSLDDSLKIIKKFKDPRINLITSDRNLGICKAVNFCFKKANGKYLSIIASDDIMLPDNLEKKVNFLELNPEYGAVFSGIEAIDEKNRILQKKTKKFERIFISENKKKHEWLNHFFYKGNCIAAPTFVTTADCVKNINGFNELISQAHDFDMWVRICLAGYEMHVLPENLVQYRQRRNNQNLSSNTSDVRKRLVFDNEKILENYLSIKNMDDLIKVFPNLPTRHKQISEDLIPFLIALESMKVNDPSHHQFALTTLFNLLKNLDIRKTLEKEFNFTDKELLKLITNNPLGSAIECMHKIKFYNSLLKKFISKLKNFTNR